MATERDETYWLKSTITMLEAQVGGLEYELRMRDIRLEEQSRYIGELEQRVEELKKQAVGEGLGERELPGFVKPNVPRRPRKKPGAKKDMSRRFARFRRRSIIIGRFR